MKLQRDRKSFLEPLQQEQGLPKLEEFFDNAAFDPGAVFL